MKDDHKTPKGGSKSFILKIFFLLLNITNSAVPVTGFALRNVCRISFDIAICVGNNPELRAVPRDIPPTVKGFDLSANKISQIQALDFKNLPLLTLLDLKYNEISKIEPGAFSQLTSLEKLNLNNNRLGSLDDGLFDGLGNLTELRIYRNKIKTVASGSLKSLTSLTFLDISRNRLEEPGKIHTILQQLPNLQKLIIMQNNIRTFQSQDLTNKSLTLTHLDLSKNPIQVFRITSDIFPDLAWLNVGSTTGKAQITWDVSNKNFFRGLSTLDISAVKLGFDETRSLLESVNSSLGFLRMNQMNSRLTELINISCTIPTMSQLQLRLNNLKSVHSNMFYLCKNVTELDLSHNKIANIDDNAFVSIQGLRILTLSSNLLKSVQAATMNLPNLSELDLSKNKIGTLDCHNFANLTKLRQLNLYANLISSLNECVFAGLTQLQVLKLQNNSISKLDGAFKKHLPNLQQLHLSSNKLASLSHGVFKGLRSLQNLSLHSNQIQVLENGSFSGLTNLTEILLQSNNINAKTIEKGAFGDLINLRRLDLRNNHIRYFKSGPLSQPPFSRLSNLETLAIPAQRRRGKSQLPCNILQGLTNLLVFNCRNSQLWSLSKDLFTYTPGLQTLDISSNELQDLSPDLFSQIPNLRSLYISRTNLRSLDFIIDANITQLEFIQARKNAFSVIREDVFKCLRGLVYADFQGNSFTCDCDNAWFIQWVKNNNQTQVFDAYNFECNYPPFLKGKKLLEFDTQSCTVNTDFICFVFTTSAILLFMAVSFTYHFLRWQLTYAYYFFLALLFDTKNKNRQTPNQYDAFVSYNTHDEPWVIRKLLPKLEEEQGWRLCLHHRDFEPGKAALCAYNHLFLLQLSCILPEPSATLFNTTPMIMYTVVTSITNMKIL